MVVRHTDRWRLIVFTKTAFPGTKARRGSTWHGSPARRQSRQRRHQTDRRSCSSSHIAPHTTFRTMNFFRKLQSRNRLNAERLTNNHNILKNDVPGTGISGAYEQGKRADESRKPIRISAYISSNEQHSDCELL